MDRQISDIWQRGSPYELYMGRWSRRVAPLFLDWLGLPPGLRWLDVGCGTGALSAAILDRCAPRSVDGVDSSAGVLETARENLAGRAQLQQGSATAIPQQGSATAIPLGDGAADAVVSGLVLNFVPDPPAALAEMARVAVRGGTIAGYVWDYGGTMELMSQFWDAAAEINPQAPTMAEGAGFALCNPAALEALFATAGLEGSAVTALDIPTPFVDFDDYWAAFLGGVGQAPAYAMSLDEAARGCLRDRLRERLPIAADGSIALKARAWAVRGTVAGR
jgi:SAM-dependent methyltransferase